MTRPGLWITLGSDGASQAQPPPLRGQGVRFPHRFPTCHRARLRCGDGALLHFSTAPTTELLLIRSSSEAGGGYLEVPV